MAYPNGISIVKKQEPDFDTRGVYDVLLNDQMVAKLWNDPGNTTTGWKSTTWYIENYAAKISHIYESFNDARYALREDRPLYRELCGAWLMLENT